MFSALLPQNPGSLLAEEVCVQKKLSTEDPQLQVMAARRRLKFHHARNHRTVLHAKSRFSASSEARYFRKVVLSGAGASTCVKY